LCSAREGGIVTEDPSRQGKKTPPTDEKKSPPYNLVFAIVAALVAGVAYVLTMWLFQDLIKAPEDAAIVSGAVGGLFTLIGTVTGAYFGIKSTSDANDKARAERERKGV